MNSGYPRALACSFALGTLLLAPGRLVAEPITVLYSSGAYVGASTNFPVAQIATTGDFDGDEIVNGGGNTHRFEAKCFKAVLATAPPPQGSVIFLQ